MKNVELYKVINASGYNLSGYVLKIPYNELFKIDLFHFLSLKGDKANILQVIKPEVFSRLVLEKNSDVSLVDFSDDEFLTLLFKVFSNEFLSDDSNFSHLGLSSLNSDEIRTYIQKLHSCFSNDKNNDFTIKK